MGFAPVSASEKIVEKYKRYLNTIFQIADANYSNQFKNELANPESFSAGPFLDVTDSFVKGRTITQLISDGILAEGVNRIKMPQERPLYQHQENAIKRVIGGQNIVVSTGTGSGKTESFLIPIFNQLIKEDENNELTPGVRALIIYPMNALANDQMERLRELLADYGQITYGSYTGQTKDEFEKALLEYKALNNGQVPNENELISRDQMKKTPPHILITNYAMLEYLMLRPEDSVFFDLNHSETWKFIVLDEAHVYNGSTGIEVSMLLRRLKAKLQNDNLQYILTSATLGGESDNIAVAEFATNLCNSEFSTANVVRAERIIHKTSKEKYKLNNEFYNIIAELIDKKESDEVIITEIKKHIDYSSEFVLLEEILYDIFLHDELYWKIRELLVEPKTVKSVSDSLKMTEQEVANFVTVASKCDRDGDKLFDARYHMFLRATESVFVTLNPSRRLFLTRKLNHIEENGDSFKVFEIATCTSCHCIYLIGKENNGYLEQCSSFADSASRIVFLMSDSIADLDEDHTLEDERINAEKFEICSKCGHLYKTGLVKRDRCEHGEEYYVRIIRVNIQNETGRLNKCLACESINNYGILRQFFTGQEAVTSVIGTALFEELPSYSIKVEIKEPENDDSGFGFSAISTNLVKVEEAKQFLAFSDSRQAAAFYASYMDQTYKNILYKRLVVETISGNEYRKGGKNLNQVVEDLIYQFETYKIANKNVEQTRKEAWKAILQEVIDNNGNTSLNRMGLLGVSIDGKGIPANEKFNLTASDVASMCSVFALGMLADAAVLYEVLFNKAEKEYFTHGGVEYTYTKSDANPKEYRRSFVPTLASKTNKRLDYLMRVLVAAGFEVDKSKATELLSSIFDRILCNPNLNILKINNGKCKIDAEKVIISNGNEWFICPKCKKVTIHNVYNVCPTYNCNGSLISIDLDEELKSNHYYKLFQSLEIRELRVVEHTAQLDKETAYDYQKKFKRKEIDILSCSTTFEMGVDVGSLETVFMRNMPPSPSNYAQRAGRAGRSKHSAAYALTFCNKSNHDFAFFKNPSSMIKGKINPPKFNIENEKIAIRHVYASALSYFWKNNPSYFSIASEMAEKNNSGFSGFDLFESYLEEKPEELRSYIKRFLPDTLVERFKVNDFGWTEGLLRDTNEKYGVLKKAISEYEFEVMVLEDSKKRLLEAELYTEANILKDRIKNYKRDDILAFLSRKNVLPKYGFPVDTVEMSIVDVNGKNKLGLQLQRDLSMAISEYAPGSQIVANGNLITSRYIRKIPNMSWKMFDYIYCGECKTLNIATHIEEEEFTLLKSCTQCKTIFSKEKRATFIVPEFGFEADGDKIEKPGLVKPKKTYKSEIAYVGNKKGIDPLNLKIGNSQMELFISQSDEMSVLNESSFFVCESCGYTELINKYHMSTKQVPHKNSSGYGCKNDGNNKLKRYSLGYRFETDVLQLRFINPDISDWEIGLSVLNGVMRGICRALNIEQSDISGCLQYFYNEITNSPNYALIFYDKTPGGAGHVRRINNEVILEQILEETYKLMENCDCGGKEKDSSCYTCLRSYYNQNHHDLLKRKHVIDFIDELRNSTALNKEYSIKRSTADLGQIDGVSEEWNRTLSLLYNSDDERAYRLALGLIRGGIDIIPEVGYELSSEEMGVLGFDAEMAWPDKKIAVLKDANDEMIDAFKSDGWKIFRDEETNLEVLIDCLQ